MLQTMAGGDTTPAVVIALQDNDLIHHSTSKPRKSKKDKDKDKDGKKKKKKRKQPTAMASALLTCAWRTGYILENCFPCV